MQIITLSGRIGGDAETRRVNDQDVTSFNLASDQGYGDRKTTNWFRISIWGKKGSGAAPYLVKGGVVTVIGELEIGEYNGKLQYNVRAVDFTLPPKPRDEQRYQGNGGTQARRQRGDEGHIPFVDDLDDDDDTEQEWLEALDKVTTAQRHAKAIREMPLP